MYRFLADNVDKDANNVVQLESYSKFVVFITTLSLTITTGEIPEYIDWRKKTKEITLKSISVRNIIEASNEKRRSGFPTEVLPKADLAFHREFGELMQLIDTSIQEFDSAAGSRRIALHRTLISGTAAAFTLLVSLFVALTSITKAGDGVSHQWNLIWGVVLVGITTLLFILLFRCYLIYNISRQEWIDQRISSHRASLDAEV
jgi:hypothetical protein